MQIVSILNNNSKLARVQLEDGSIIDGVVILYPFGLFSNIAINDNSMGLLLEDGSNDYSYVMPFSISAQPTLASGEIAVGDFVNNKTIKFLQNGTIQINGDVVIIPPYFSRVKLSGEVKRKGIFELKNNINKYRLIPDQFIRSTKNKIISNILEECSFYIFKNKIIHINFKFIPKILRKIIIKIYG